MPDHDALLHTAHLQWGYVTAQQAAACGFSRQLCHHYCRKGSWVHVARSLFRVHAVPARPDEDLARVSLLAHDKRGRPAGVLSHHTALYLHGMLTQRPDRIHMSLDPMSRAFEPEGVVVFHRRIDLPWRSAGEPAWPAWLQPAKGPPPPDEGLSTPRRFHWVEPWRPRAVATGPRAGGRQPSVAAEDIEDRGCFRVTTPLRTVLDAMTWRRHHDLSKVIERGLDMGLYDLDGLLKGIETMLRVPGERALWEVKRALKRRARGAARDLATIRMRIFSVEHRHGQPFGPAWALRDAEDELAEIGLAED
ncbi:MAG: hypothetical protein P8Y02_12280, partial [Deinococcales bacterium]